MKHLSHQIRPALITLLLFISSASSSLAGWDEGYAAYQAHDYTRALSEWLPDAERGNMHSQFALGTMYKDGEGVSADTVKAAEWFRKAAEQGHAAAQCELGALLVGVGGASQLTNKKEGVLWLKKAAEQGNIRAKSLLEIFDDSSADGAMSTYVEEPHLVAEDKSGARGVGIFGRAYDDIGWAISAALFLFFALGSGQSAVAIRRRLPAFLGVKRVCLTLAALAASMFIVKAMQWF